MSNDFIGLDISPALEEMRRERASLARMAAAIGLALVLLAGWGLVKRVDQIFSSSVQRPGGTALEMVQGAPNARLRDMEISGAGQRISQPHD